MKKSVLYYFLSTSNKRLLNRFEKFIQSRYFNSNVNCEKLFSIFQREFNLGSKGVLKSESIYAELFPNENYNNQKIRLLYSETYRLFKSFLTLEEHPYYKTDNLDLAKYYQEIGKEDLYERTMDKIESNLDKQEYRNGKYFLSKYNLAKEKYYYQTSTKRLKVVPYDKVISTFDVYYYIEKLRQGCILKAHKNTALNSSTEPDLFYVVQRCESNPQLIKTYPTLAIYFYCFKALSDTKGDHKFNIFQKMLLENINLFSKEESKELLIMGINFCAKKINNLERIYLEKVFSIYEIGIDKNILVHKKIISPFTFKNALSVAIEIGNKEWAERFIVKYGDYLPAKQKESVLKYCIAKLLISKGNKDPAKTILAQFYSEDILSYLSGKMLLIQLYFEDKEFDLLGSLLDNMNVYINRKKKMSYHKIHYKEVIKFTRKLINLPPFDQAARKSLREEIENSEVKLMKKEWFLEQVGGGRGNR